MKSEILQDNLGHTLQIYLESYKKSTHTSVTSKTQEYLAERALSAIKFIANEGDEITNNYFELIRKLCVLEAIIQADEDRQENVIYMGLQDLLTMIKERNDKSLSSYFHKDNFEDHADKITFCEDTIKIQKNRKFKSILNQCLLACLNETIDFSKKEIVLIDGLIRHISSYKSDSKLEPKVFSPPYNEKLIAPSDARSKAKLHLKRILLEAIYTLILNKSSNIQEYQDVISQARFFNGELQREKKTKELSDIASNIKVSELLARYDAKSRPIYIEEPSGFKLFNKNKISFERILLNCENVCETAKNTNYKRNVLK